MACSPSIVPTSTRLYEAYRVDCTCGFHRTYERSGTAQQAARLHQTETRERRLG